MPAARPAESTQRRTGAENRKNYSGRNNCHGLLVIALTDNRGRLLRVSATGPGGPRRSPLAATTNSPPISARPASGPSPTWFVGLGGSGPDTDPAAITGYKAARHRPLTRGQKLSDKTLAAVRAPVEHGFAHLRNWRVLGKARTYPRWATALVRALLVLSTFRPLVDTSCGR
ncbi:transposase family protein [Streptomyces olivaceoviridis]